MTAKGGREKARGKRAAASTLDEQIDSRLTAACRQRGGDNYDTSGGHAQDEVSTYGGDFGRRHW